MPVILICPDSFKESLTADEAVQAMQRGVLSAVPDAQCLCLPLADGGEGTLAALAQRWPLQRLSHSVRGPLGEPVVAEWGMLEHTDGRRIGVIEMASASGLLHVPPARRDPLRSSSYGFGELLLQALEAGCDELLLTLGGSATHDGGLGMLCALGAQAFDADGEPLTPTGEGLGQLARLDMRDVPARLRQTPITVICDVRNPLCGANGAAHIFAPQKGASPEQVRYLEAASQRWAGVLAELAGYRVDEQPGAGAAGGLGAALLGCLGATLRPGIDLLLEVLEFDALLAQADLVLTGEGQLDAQTAAGKVIAGVAERARRQHKPVVALVGAIRGGDVTAAIPGLTACFAINPEPVSLSDALARASVNLEYTSRQTVALWASSLSASVKG